MKQQLILILVAPGQELDGEIHAEADQFFCIKQGKGRIVIDGVTQKVKPGDCALVPAGAYHNLFCAGHEPPKIYTIHGPPASPRSIGPENESRGGSVRRDF